MYKQLLIHQLIQEDYNRCTDLYNQFQRQLPKLPPGSLHLRNGSYYYHVRKNGKQYSIKITDNKLINQLKQKRFIKNNLQTLKTRIETCKQYLQNDTLYDPIKAQQDLPAQYRNLQTPNIYLQGDVNIAYWLKSGNKNKAPYEEEHYTGNGVRCRSKSEALIGTRLEQRGLLYIVEPEITLSTRTIYPDFQILLPASRRIITHEHFGKIEDLKYNGKNFTRLNDYLQDGFTIGYDMFFTYETLAHPLNMKDIDRAINNILQTDLNPFVQSEHNPAYH